MKSFSPERTAQFYRDGSWTGDCWRDYLQRNIRRFPDFECVADAPNKDRYMPGPVRRLTWAQVDTAVARLAAAFYRDGLRAGDPIGIQIPNSVELAITYLALNRLGCILSPYPTAYRTHEISQLAEIADVRAIVTTDGFVGRDAITELADVAGAHKPACAVYAWYLDLDDGRVSNSRVPILEIDADDVFSNIEVDDESYFAYIGRFSPDPNDVAIIIFTSGTTGVPKGVPRAHGDSLFSAHSTAASPQLNHEDVILAPMPMVNAGAIGGIFLPWIVTGCRLIMHQPFSVDIWLDQLESERVTYTLVAPTLLNDIAGNPTALGDRDLSALRVVGSGSAPLAGWAIKYWEDELQIEVLNLFGATEGVQLFSDSDTMPDPERRARFIPMPGSPRFKWRNETGRLGSAKIVNTSTGKVIDSEGESGELLVKGANLFSGYLNADSPFDEDGYYHTGDIFEFVPGEPDLMMHVDRLKDLIIRGGINVSASEVESLVGRHTKVSEVAAVGVKDIRLGERTCVVVVPVDIQDPPTLSELVDFLAAQGVAKFKFPERIEIVRELPRNPSGKVLKRDLRAWINQDEGTSL